MIIAYNHWGVWAALLSVPLPGVSQAFWAYMMWGRIPYYSGIVIVSLVLATLHGAVKGAAEAVRDG